MWAKGQSGNPKGRPPNEQAVAVALRRLLRTTEPATRKSYRSLVVRALVDAALAGNVEAIKTIFERVDGKLPTPVEVSGRDGAPIGVGTFDYFAAVAALGGDAPPAALAAGPNGHRPPPGQDPGRRDGPEVGEDPDGR